MDTYARSGRHVHIDNSLMELDEYDSCLLWIKPYKIENVILKLIRFTVKDYKHI